MYENKTSYILKIFESTHNFIEKKVSQVSISDGSKIAVCGVVQMEVPKLSISRFHDGNTIEDVMALF